MHWRDLPLNPTPRILRQFAAAWLVVFLALGLFEAFGRGRPIVGGAVVAVALLGGVAGLVRPRLLRPVFVGWIIAVFPITWGLSRLALILLFFGMFTPVALFFRTRGRDLLQLRRPAGATFWRPKPMRTDPRSYFRQF
jgi:hypothetical protein